MMNLVQTKPKSFADYKEIIDIDTALQLEYYAEKVQKKIAMVNATAYGGGVAEIMHSFIPIAKDLGIHIDWWTMEGADEFYNVTKAFHNCLQGHECDLHSDARQVYLKYNEINAAVIKEWDYDIIVIHDPQPAALMEYAGKKNGQKWIWRCHIDTSHPHLEYWDFLYQYIKKYDACIFTMQDFAKENETLPNLTFFPPAIDPLSIKNKPLDEDDARAIIARFGVDINRPLITQISRFDPWKDPLGVIEVYKIVQKEFPSVQLALVGSMATDDPEGWDYLYQSLRRAGEDYDIKIITNFNGVSNLEVNAFQTCSDVLLQKSIREGFGLTVAEGHWKGKPVIGGNTGGIRLQIEDGVNGYLVNTVEECAEKVLTLLRNPQMAKEMGETGKENVAKNFLITTNILNYLKLIDTLH